MINSRREEQGRGSFRPNEEKIGMTKGFTANIGSLRGRVYNFFHAHTTRLSYFFDHFINVLIVGTALTFIVGTVNAITDPRFRFGMDIVELSVSQYFQSNTFVEFTQQEKTQNTVDLEGH
jgi:hypothetical protein